ncbi:Domain of unknown function DUF1713, mitochondria [Phaffia rhodozyma]|uniref:Small ribosomal subunit protein mS38 n=1 Tax=Phaffia rhodozyma TaxID=264483 RepID=A0A0F7SPN1_PHARH|nr:Domain of unknown function DUF1713, mitochondria [Phaffia rhodozyma]
MFRPSILSAVSRPLARHFSITPATQIGRRSSLTSPVHSYPTLPDILPIPLRSITCPSVPSPSASCAPPHYLRNPLDPILHPDCIPFSTLLETARTQSFVRFPLASSALPTQADSPLEGHLKMYGKRLPAEYETAAREGDDSLDASERRAKLFEWERCTSFRATCMKRLAEKKLVRRAIRVGNGRENTLDTTTAVGGILMDSVKRKRKKMMSKHKYNKRRKATRTARQKLGK